MSGQPGIPPTDGAVHHDAFARRICLRHAAWLADATGPEEVPPGWRPLVERLFADLAEVATVDRHDRLELRRLRRVDGRLVVDLTPADLGTDGERSTMEVRRLIDEAGRQSLSTCSICGAEGRPRILRGDWVALCDVHAGAAGADRVSPDASDPASPEPRDTAAVPTGTATRQRIYGRAGRWDLALYDLDDVASAIGELGRGPAGACDTETWSGDPPDPGPEGEQQLRLRRILDAGDAARWRELARPGPTCLDELDALEASAPHMSEMTAVVRRHLMAAVNVGLPIALSPIMLHGPPGIGKSWYLGRLARVLGIPFKTYRMTGQSLADGLYGSHGVWRNARPGLVARTLLAERFANPLLLVDEVDKASTQAHEDPYRAFYDLLELEGARDFRDEYLQFALDASRVVWVLAGNDPDVLPAPIRDRLAVVEVARPGETHLRAVAESIYRGLNSERRSFFDPELPESTVARLLGRSPRAVRRSLVEAMTRAAAEGRHRVSPDDVPEPPAAPRRVGF